MPRSRKLLEPIRIGTLELKNRIAMSPMSTAMLDKEGLPTKQAMEFYFRRAEGGAGLVMIQPGTILPESRCVRIIPLHDDKYIPSLARIAQGVKDRGAKVSFELVHHGVHLAKGRMGLNLKDPDEVHVIGPSPVPAPGITVIPRQMTKEDIEHVTRAFAAAASRVRRAGYDAVQIQVANGFLLHQFRSPAYNRRQDEYGGSAVNRARMACEVIAAVRKTVGPGFPIIVRMSGSDHSAGGVTVEDSVKQAPLFVEAGADALDVVGGSLETKNWIFSSSFMPPMLNLAEAEAIRKVVRVPVMVAGKMGQDIPAAERVVQDGRVDMIVLGRALIADPDWPRKVASGRLDEVRPCLACNECANATSKLRYIRCSVNAVAGREIEYGTIKPAQVKKRVLVVGGGPAGMETARVAALKGHEVTLCERYRQLGGLMQLGAVHNERIMEFVRWLVAEIRKLPIEVKLGTEVTPSLVAELNPDVVVFAGGGTFAIPQIRDINRGNVFSAQDLLNLMNGIPVRKGALGVVSAVSPLVRRLASASTVRRLLETNFPIKKRVAVIGGQFPGCSLAIALANAGKKVTVIEESDHFGEGMESHIMMRLESQVRAGDVKVLTSTRVDEITDDGVVIDDGKANRTKLDVDSVVVALDLAPSDSRLVEELKDKVKEVHVVGDATSFGRIIKAVSDGYATAYNL